MAAATDGSRVIRRGMDGDPSDPGAGGRALAEALLAAGADALTGGR